MDKSGDFGKMIYNIREKDTDYKIIFTDTSDRTLKTTESMKFLCTDSVCELTVMLDPYSATTTSTSLEVITVYDAGLGNITTTWTDPAAGTNAVRTMILRPLSTGTQTLCDSNQSGSSGSNVCSVSAYTGTVEYTVFDDGEVVVTEWITLNSTKLGILVGDDEGGVWAGLILITCVMFGAAVSPVVSLLAMVFGLVIIFLLGLFTPVTLTFVVAASVAVIFIGYLVKK